MNLLTDEGWLEQTHPPPKEGFEWKRRRVAGERLGASLYELLPGQKTFPYHYELGNDELLVVVSGTPTLVIPTESMSCDRATASSSQAARREHIRSSIRPTRGASPTRLEPPAPHARPCNRTAAS